MDKRRYILTEHASDVMKKRQIKLAWIERALALPSVKEADPVDADLQHYFLPIAEFGDCVLHVVVNTRKIPPHVVTAFFDRRRSLS